MQPIKKIFDYLLLMVAALFSFFPLIFMFMGSTHANDWIFSSTLSLSIGNNFYLNFITLIDRFPLFIALFNSLLTSIFSTSLSLILILFVIIVSTQLFKKMTRVIEGLFLVFMFLPQSASIIGTIYTINALGLTNNLMGIILSSLINLRIYFYLKDEFLNLSSEIFESLAIDGVGTFKLIMVIFGGIFREKVLFSFFLIFISNWNNFLVPINVISKELLFTLPVLIASLSDPLNYFIGETFLALLFQTIPLILLYIFLMRSIDSNYEL